MSAVVLALLISIASAQEVSVESFPVVEVELTITAFDAKHIFAIGPDGRKLKINRAAIKKPMVDKKARVYELTVADWAAANP